MLRFLALPALIVALAPATASGSPGLYPHAPPSNGRVPGFSIGEREAIAIAKRVPTVSAERRSGALVPRVTVLGEQSWLVEFVRAGKTRAAVQIDGRSGRVTSVESGRTLDWPRVYHGLHGPTARHTTIGMAILALLFMLPFARPPYGWLHFDLLALLSLGVSYAFAARGDVYVATPLFYPPLLYLTARLVLLSRRAGGARAVASWMPTRFLAGGLLVILAGRYAFDAFDGYVSDIGYASLYGADSIRHGYDIYSSKAGNLDTYGPFAYLTYVPFSWAIPFDLAHAHAGAARAAAMVFDAATVAGLVVLGRRLRDWRLGLTLGWGFAAFPFTFFALAANTNDALVAALLVWLLVVASRPAWRGLVLGLAVMTKFAPLILGGLLLRVQRERGARAALAYLGVLAATIVVLVWAYLPDGGLRELWDATIRFQLTRSSPFSMWGLHPGWSWAHVVMQILAAALAIAAIAIPVRRDLPQLAAMGAALIIAAQLTATHWYYFYMSWFVPYALVALSSTSYAGSVRNSGSSSARAVATNSS